MVTCKTENYYNIFWAVNYTTNVPNKLLSKEMMNGIAECSFLEKSLLVVAESLEHTVRRRDLLEVSV